MKRSKHSFIALSVAIAVIAIGCTGGDSDSFVPPPLPPSLSVASLHGVYSSIGYRQTASTTTAVNTNMVFDGAGNLSWTLVILSNIVTLTGTYTVAADGSLHIDINSETITGKVSGDAAQILIADADSAAGVEGSMSVMTKVSTAYTNESLSGEYVASTIKTQTGVVSSFKKGFNFDGAGNVDISVDLGAGVVTSSDTYTVAANGTVVMAGDGGWLSANENILTLASDDGSSNADMTVALKSGAEHTAASVAGVYHFGEFTDTTPSSPSSGAGTLTLNANGTLSISVTISANDTLTRTGTFTVTDPSGTLEFVIGGNTLVGAISANGQTVIYSDEVADATPEIYIAIRK